VSRRAPRPGSPDRGQVLVIFGLALTAMMAMAGLLMDGGMAWANRRQAQAAADTAALAAAQAAAQGAGDLVSAAQDIASANGFPKNYTDCGGHPRTDGFVINGPFTKPAPDTNRYVEAIVTRPMKTTFSAVVGQSCWMVGARAVARVGSLGTFLTQLQDLHLRVSYFNSDDINTYFEYYAVFSIKRGASTIPVASVSNLCYRGVMNNQGSPIANMADVVVQFPAITPVQLASGDVLQLQLSTKVVNTGTCPGFSHTTGAVMLWYDSTQPPYQSKFSMTIGGTTADQYLHSNGTGATRPTPGVSSLSFSPAAPTTSTAKTIKVNAPQTSSPAVTFSGNAGSPVPTLWTQTIGPTPPVIPSVLVE
jgi:Tfp pilus assembly protein PilX